MTIIQQILLCLSGWISIIILAAISQKKIDAFSHGEMVKDGNNLFSTAVTYILANALCMYLDIVWLEWIIFIGLLLFAIIPFLSSVLLMFSRITPFAQKLSAIISQAIPVVIAANIYFTSLR